MRAKLRATKCPPPQGGGCDSSEFFSRSSSERNTGTATKLLSYSLQSKMTSLATSLLRPALAPKGCSLEVFETPVLGSFHARPFKRESSSGHQALSRLLLFYWTLSVRSSKLTPLKPPSYSFPQLFRDGLDGIGVDPNGWPMICCARNRVNHSLAEWVLKHQTTHEHVLWRRLLAVYESGDPHGENMSRLAGSWQENPKFVEGFYYQRQKASNVETPKTTLATLFLAETPS